MEITVTARWDIEKSRGKVLTGDINIADFDIPKEFGGSGSAASPEQLFMASVASCMITTFIYLAKKLNLHVEEVFAEVSGRLERAEKGGYKIGNINVNIGVKVGKGEEKDAENCLRALDTYCIIKNTLESPPPITVRFEVKSA